MRFSTLAIALVVASNAASALAAGPQSNRNVDTTVLNKPAVALTADDMLVYLDLALGEKITADQARQFMSKLTKAQFVQLRRALDEIAAQRNDSPEALYQASQNDRFFGPNQADAMAAAAICDPAAQQQGFCWRQMIEFRHGAEAVQGRGPSWHQRYSTICDNDPADTDLVVYFDISSLNPDKLRWHSSSPGVLTVTTLSDMNGFDFDNVGAHLCIPNRVSQLTPYTDAQIAASMSMWVVK